MTSIFTALSVNELEQCEALSVMCAILQKHEHSNDANVLLADFDDEVDLQQLLEHTTNCFLILYQLVYGGSQIKISDSLAAKVVEKLLMCCRFALFLTGNAAETITQQHDVHVIFHVIIMSSTLLLAVGDVGINIAQIGGGEVLSKIVVLAHILQGRYGHVELDASALLAASPHEQMYAVRQAASSSSAGEVQLLAEMPGSTARGPAVFQSPLTLRNGDKQGISGAETATTMQRLSELLARCDDLVRRKGKEKGNGVPPGVSEKDVQQEVGSLYTQAVIGAARWVQMCFIACYACFTYTVGYLCWFTIKPLYPLLQDVEFPSLLRGDR
jgi:hypothetical protein